MADSAKKKAAVDWDKCQCDKKAPEDYLKDTFEQGAVTGFRFDNDLFTAEARNAAPKIFLSLEEFAAAKIPCTIDRVLRHSKYPEDDDSHSGKSFLPIIIVRRAKLMLGNKDLKVKHELMLGQLELVENNWLQFLPISERLMLFHLKTLCQLECRLYADARVSHDKAMEILAEMEEDWPAFKPGFISLRRSKLCAGMHVIVKNGGVNRQSKDESKLMPTLEEVNPENPVLSKSLYFKNRRLFANEDIPPGQIVAIEEDFVRVPIRFSDRCRASEECHRCLGDTFGLALPCRTCSLVIFCSLECRDLALQGFHKYECSLGIAYMIRYPLFNYYVPSILRVMLSLTSEERSSFIEWIRSNGKIPCGGNATMLCDLFFPNNERKQVMFSQGHPDTLGLLQLATMFKEAKIIIPPPNVLSVFALDQKRYLRKVRKIHFEAVEMKASSVGNALYANLSLVSHSCLANAWHFSLGRKTILFTTRAVKAGEEITISYYEEYENDFSTRQFTVEACYGVTCKCLACTNEWGDLRKTEQLKQPDKVSPDELLRFWVQESMHRHKEMSAESYAVWTALYGKGIMRAMALKYI